MSGAGANQPAAATGLSPLNLSLATGDFRQIALERAGDAPFVFQGRLLRAVSGEYVRPPKGRANIEFFVLRLFETQRLDEPFVVAILYRKDFRELYEHQTVVPTDDPAAVLRAYRPLDVVIPFPPEVDNRFARQGALDDKFRRQYAALVTELFR